MDDEEAKALENGIAALRGPAAPDKDAAKRRAAEVLDAYGITGALRDILAGDMIELPRSPARRS